MGFIKHSFYLSRFRCQITSLECENPDELYVLDLDYGGYYNVKYSDCRQIRADLVTYPFQATEAHLANVMPVDGVSYPKESQTAAEELMMGTVLTANVVGYHAVDMRPLVELFTESAEGPVSINQELVCRGLAAWVE